jgi:hypothetical protein
MLGEKYNMVTRLGQVLVSQLGYCTVHNVGHDKIFTTCVEYTTVFFQSQNFSCLMSAIVQLTKYFLAITQFMNDVENAWCIHTGVVQIIVRLEFSVDCCPF